MMKLGSAGVDMSSPPNTSFSPKLLLPWHHLSWSTLPAGVDTQSPYLLLALLASDDISNKSSEATSEATPLAGWELACLSASCLQQICQAKMLASGQCQASMPVSLMSYSLPAELPISLSQTVMVLASAFSECSSGNGCNPSVSGVSSCRTADDIATLDELYYCYSLHSASKQVIS